MPSPRPRRVAVFGAGGGIGAALVAQLISRDDVGEVFALSRTAPPVPADTRGKRVPLAFDLTDEASIAAAAARIAAPLDLCIIATGILTLPDGTGPEKGARQIDPAAMARVFALNTIGPALIAKHLLPLLPRDRPSVFAALSARVGSIGDNRMGGWHSYRASKAALNMLVRNFAIELGRTHRLAICVGLHPGTVDTGLSAPFQRGVPAEQLFTPELSAAHLLRVIDGLTPADSGGCFAWDGARIEP
ncbi:SDR family NAD(P)-dependent oxidoreductase [Novosphingobium piscinae]|uniref:SDR family NAD(P)-dependent oxidoreductase n=1 Tax=Novosphingobium piscinae TaxID=1507448 RepID=A0A7X1KQB9_9SPHN|nr:SDR family NAD(P)-dependent oxidoreductase [Novosphingobium piscinae]MBC2669599.1 SDR family NAD(P)-dependent oxidoreductase [Novosphingobium piscinae]